MAKKDFLYCEETDIKIYPNDVVILSTYPNTKWIAKHGWYTVGSTRSNGWYFVSIADKTVLSLSNVELNSISKSAESGVIEEHPTVVHEPTPVVVPEYIETPNGNLKDGDVVTISGYSDVQWIVKYGWYHVDTAQIQGWYFLSIADRTILPISLVDISTITKEVYQGTSELRPTLADMDTIPAEPNYIVIPDTDIRLYESDIITISNRPGKWIIHRGWYIFQDVQNFGWYFEAIKDGEILPVSIIDLQLCTLVTVKTQGSEQYDGRVVNYTRPFTKSDAEVLNRTFITVETIEQRDNLDKHKLVNGRIVRVNDAGGVVVYYAWNAATHTWDKVDFGGGGSGSGIPELVGTEDNPIVLSGVPEGLYRVIGVYKICSGSTDTITTDIHHLAFINNTGETILIKVVTESDIQDYSVLRGIITFSNIYATERYVDDKITVLEQQISEIISELMRDLPNIIDERVSEIMRPIPESFIRGLFA